MLQKSEWTHMNSFYNYPISIVEDIIVLCNDPLANDLEDIIHAVTRLGVDEGEIGYVRKSYYLHRVRLCKFSCLRSSSDFLLPCLKLWTTLSQAVMTSGKTASDVFRRNYFLLF